MRKLYPLFCQLRQNEERRRKKSCYMRNVDFETWLGGSSENSTEVKNAYIVMLCASAEQKRVGLPGEVNANKLKKRAVIMSE